MKIHLLKSAFILYLVFNIQYSASAQQDPQYTQYMFNMLAINPAYAGSRDVVSATALYRRQWWGVDGAPQTMTFSADMPIRKEKIGVGIVASNDRLGRLGVSNLSGYFSYRIKVHSRGTLAFGITGGGSFYSTDFNNIRLSEDPSASASDPAFQQYASVQPLVGGGVYYSTDRFYVGFSAPNLLSYNLVRATETESSAKKFQHVFLMAGYVFPLTEVLTLKPSGLVKWVMGAPTQMDLNAQLWFYDKMSAGLSARTDGGGRYLSSLSILLELQATENIRIGYAYDFPFNNTRRLSYNTHEIMIRYEMGFRNKKMISPRYF